MFHKTKVDLQKWFLAIALFRDREDHFTIKRLAEKLRVNKNTAWYMVDRIKRERFKPEVLFSKIGNLDIMHKPVHRGISNAE